ncbi:MAG: phosphate signaling complex protein PhoU [Planctomycetota bacterium]|nr:phosphate signaling complex protein PhoU [Planctomycetota bacterium]
MKHMLMEFEKLKKKILALSAIVEESVHRAVSSIQRRDEKLARKVIDSDIEIDHMEVDVEEECLKILALHQPVATDLRFVIAVLKINNDLERIADLSVNIAEQGAYLATQTKVNIPFDFPGMAEKAQRMLRQSLDALVNMDSATARKVMAADDEVDAINRHMYDQVKEGIRRSPENLDCLIHLLSVSRHLERIADHATNIAEDVIYMVEGEIIRHRTEEYFSNVQKAATAKHNSLN